MPRDDRTCVVAARRRSTRSTRARSRTRDGDGVGDLRGHRGAARPPRRARRCEAVWLSPFFPSPMADFGYDVVGLLRRRPDLRHARRLRRAGRATRHARGIRVILDWVPNHTSDRHPWFAGVALEPRRPQARLVRVARPGAAAAARRTTGRRRSRPSARRGRSTSATGQWYLHSFLPEQPDLNWDNPEVEAAMHDVLRFWLDRGVDGFRIDAIAQDRQGPAAARQHRRRAPPRRGLGHASTSACAGSARVVDEYPDRMIVGEVALQDLHRVVSYLKTGDQLHLAHNFVVRATCPGTPRRFRDLDRRLRGARRPDGVAGVVPRQPRPLARRDALRRRRPRPGAGAGGRRCCSTRCAGRRSSTRARSSGCPTPRSRPTASSTSTAATPSARRSRGGRRPPAGPGAGFTTGEPWLPLVADAEALNVERQAADPRSTLALVRRLAALRAQHAGAADRRAAHARRRPRRARLAARGRRRALAGGDQLRDGARRVRGRPRAPRRCRLDRPRPAGGRGRPRRVTLGGSEAVLLRLG